MTTTDSMPLEAVRLMGELMAANADHLHNLNRSLLASAEAERNWLRDGLAAALSGIPKGDTTATYERGLDRIRSVRYPPYEVMDAYRERAERLGVVLDTDDRGPVIEAWLDWLADYPLGQP